MSQGKYSWGVLASAAIGSFVLVQPGGSGDHAGIEPGDVIREVNQRPVNTVRDFDKSLRQSRKGDRLFLLVQRGDNEVFFALRRKGKE